MKVNVEIVLRAVDRASKEVGKLGKSFKEVGKAGDSASKQATGSFRNIDRGAKNSTKAINNVNSSLGNLGKGFTSTSRSANSFTSTLNKSMRDGSRAVTTLRTSLTGLDAGLKRNSSTVRQTQSAVTGFGRTAISTFHQVGSTSSATAQRMASSMSTASREMSNSLMSVQRTANLTGDSISRPIITGTRQAGTGFSNLSRAWSNTTSALRKGISSVVDSFGSLNGAISGAIAGFGAMQMASVAMGGAMDRELTQAWMTTKVGTQRAKEYQQAINQINMVSPAPSSFINQLVTGAVTRQTNISADALRQLGRAASDYFVASMAMGKNAVETQMDLIEYINTGNTAQLERDSIIKNQLDKLKDQATVEERIKALNEALNAEGYAGLSQLDTAKIKLEEAKGRIEEALIVLGSRILPVISQILDKFNWLDQKTGGWVSTILVAVGGIIALGGVLGLAATALQPFFKLGGALKDAVSEGGRLRSAMSSVADAGGKIKDALRNAVSEGGSLRRVFDGMKAAPGKVVDSLRNLKTAITESTIAQKLSNAATNEGIIARIRLGAASAAASIKEFLLGAASKVAAAGQALLNAVMSMNPIVLVIIAITGLIAVLLYLWKTNEGFRQAVMKLWGALQGLGNYIMGGLRKAWDDFMSTLFALQSAFTSAFGGALASAFQFISGIISFPGQVLGILWQVITGQISWSQAIQRLMSTTAMRMVMGFIRWLMGLPGRVFSILLQVISRVTGFSPRALSSAGKVGANIVKGLVQKVSEAPGKVWSEMLKIGERIMQAGSDLYNKAKEVGKKILNGLLGALGIKSPGYMYYAVSGELTRISKEFKNRTGEVKGAVEGYGEAMVNSMRGSVKLPVPEAKVDVSGAVSGVNETVSNVAGGLKGVTSISADAMKGVINTTQEGIKEWTGLYKTGTGNIQSVMDSGLKKVIEVNAKGQVKNQAILKSGTDGMVKTTKSGLESIKRSWNDMKGKVVASANATKTQVTSHISTLGGNIKRFYRLVQNPGGAGGPAGPGPIGAGFMRGLRVSVPCSTCSAPPLPLTSTNGEPLTRPLPDMQRRTVRIKRIVEEYMKSLKDPRFGFGWDYSGEWIPWVKEKIGSWPVNFLPGLKVKVKDFATWPPKGIAGNLMAFRSLMSAIIGRTRYAFYYGSSGLSPAELIRRGAFNCYDGARIVTAYARAFGLPASIRCGLSWNGIRHCAANVGGMWFDTTAFQHGYGWTSPAVKGYGGGAYVESALKTHARAGAGAVVSRDVGVSLDHNVTLEVKVKGDGVSASEVKSALTDKGVIDGIRRGLVEDEGFKSRLLRVIGEAISREERYYGL